MEKWKLFVENRYASLMLTYTLALDLERSVRHAVEFTTDKRDAFNAAFVQQLCPSYRAYREGRNGIEDFNVLKFTGDGWLLMARGEPAAKRLASLALSLLQRFESDMRALLGPSFENDPIPCLRAALCGGLDVPIVLPDGSGDYAGDSVRWAVRITEMYDPGKLFVNGTVNEMIGRNFNSKRVGEISERELPDTIFEFSGEREALPLPDIRFHETSCLAIAARRLGPLHVPRVGNVDFGFAWGGYGGPSRSPKDIVLEFSNEPWCPPQIVSDFLWRETYLRAWDKFCKDPNAPGYYFRPLLKVVGSRVDGERLHLRVQPTNFALFAATCLELHSGGLGKYLQAWTGTSSPTELQQFLAGTLNVIGTLVTNDDHLIIGKRGRAHDVHDAPGKHQASVGGHVEWLDHMNVFPEPDHHLREFVRETEEELGLRLDPARVTYFGFGYNGYTGEPDILATAAIPIASSELEAIFPRRTDSREIEKFETFDLNDAGRVKALLTLLREEKEWSGPADRAAIVATLAHRGLLQP